MQANFLTSLFTRPSPRPKLTRLGLIDSVTTWFNMSRELTKLAKRIAGATYFNAHRHAIKYEISRRVSAVIKGFDRRAQTLLFKCNLMDDLVPRKGQRAAKVKAVEAAAK